MAKKTTFFQNGHSKITVKGKDTRTRFPTKLQRNDTMNKITVFENETFGKLRGTTINGQPWFLGKDVAESLGYTNPQKAIRDHVPDNHKTVNEAFTINGTQGILIDEAAIYRLVFSSKLPKAEQFADWVTTEVLPSIRKTGGYIAGQEKHEISEDELVALAMDVVHRRLKLTEAKLAVAEEDKKKLEKENKLKDIEISNLKPKASYADSIFRCPDPILITQIAKDYGWTAQYLNELLHEKHIQFKRNGTWVLYDEYAGNGYTILDTVPYYNKIGEMCGTSLQTKWTQVGREFIYEILKKDGILPNIEKYNYEYDANSIDW